MPKFPVDAPRERVIKALEALDSFLFAAAIIS